MMNYEIFKEVVKEKFMDYMPDNFKGIRITMNGLLQQNLILQMRKRSR